MYGILDAGLKAERKLKLELGDITTEVNPSRDPDYFNPDTDGLLSRLDRTIDKIDTGTDSGHSQENLTFLLGSEIGKNALQDLLQDEIHHLKATRALLGRRKRKNGLLGQLGKLIESRIEEICGSGEICPVPDHVQRGERQAEH